MLLLALFVLGRAPAQATHVGGEMSHRYVDASGPAGTLFHMKSRTITAMACTRRAAPTELRRIP
jgi:hypothetical protein